MKAFKAIKQMMQRHICLASFDEAAAADGSCPLEQIADASGIAVGGSVLQMTRDLSRVKVLMTQPPKTGLRARPLRALAPLGPR